MYTKIAIGILAGLPTFFTAPIPAFGVCLDSNGLTSGYQIDLTTEIQSTTAIAIGRVTRIKPLMEDNADPDGITAHTYTIRVSRQLKGHLPKTIRLRIENDSGRYPMDVGEEHVLLLTKRGKYFEVNGCGHSSPLPQGTKILERIEAIYSAH